MSASKYIHRELEYVLAETLKQFPAVAVTGPRQSGKSTLLRKSLPGWANITLDDPMVRQQAADDPQLLLDRVGELLRELQPQGAVAPFDADALAASARTLLAQSDPPAVTMSAYTLQAMQAATLACYQELVEDERHAG